MNTTLQLDHINFSFSPTSEVLFKDICATFKPDSISFIKGKNGSGKSTLFRLMRGMIYENERAGGSIIVDGVRYDLQEQKAGTSALSTYIKMVAQQFDSMIAGQFTFEQNLKFAHMESHPWLAPLGSYEALPNFITHFKIPMTTPVYLLSGGQRQILAILMTLQKPVRVLLLDEPTAALDEANARMVLAFLKELGAALHLAIIIVSHDKELVELYSQGKYFELEGGMLKAS